jgi:hypothetical protein
MKKHIHIFVIALFGFFLTGCEQGSVFNSKPLIPDDVSRIETAGWDARIYEFTPNKAPNTLCIFVAGENKAGLSCFDKAVH